jgi:hypothetical protein
MLSDTTVCLPVGNYRGNLYIKKVAMTYFWAVEDDKDEPGEWDWEPIPAYVYYTLLNYSQNTLELHNDENK